MKNIPQQTKMKKFQLNAVAVVAMACGAATSHAALTISDLDTTEPASGVFLTSVTSMTTTRNVTAVQWDASTVGTNGLYGGRGNTFITPGTGGDPQWALDAITLRIHAADTVTPTSLTLQIFTWGASTVNVADIGTAFYTETVSYSPTNFAAGDYIKFNLGTTVNLNAAANYAFLVTPTNQGTGNEQLRFQIARNSHTSYTDGAMLNYGDLNTNTGFDPVYSLTYVEGPGGTTGNDDMVFYLHGAAIPEPSAALLGGLGLLALLRRRR